MFDTLKNDFGSEPNPQLPPKKAAPTRSGQESHAAKPAAQPMTPNFHDARWPVWSPLSEI